MKKKRKKSSIVPVVLIAAALAAGLGLLLYPTVSDRLNARQQRVLIREYRDAADTLDPEESRRMLEEAEAYNEALAGKSDRFVLTEEDRKEYGSILDVTGTGIMGYVEIPSIGVELPVYHGTNDEVLQTAIGHLEGTSLPVGGKGTHAVISGHRGLPSAKLFTDIDRLRPGDLFLIRVLDRTLAYEVDQIQTVLPDELQDLEIDPDEDYCTLVTCTPYGVNTHRLLVRGKRTDYTEPAEAAAEAAAPELSLPVLIPLAAAPFLLAFLIVLLAVTGRKRRQPDGPEDTGEDSRQ